MAALVGVEDDIKTSPNHHLCITSALVGYSWVLTGKSINTKSLTNDLIVGKNTADNDAVQNHNYLEHRHESNQSGSEAKINPGGEETEIDSGLQRISEDDTGCDFDPDVLDKDGNNKFEVCGGVRQLPIRFY